MIRRNPTAPQFADRDRATAKRLHGKVDGVRGKNVVNSRDGVLIRDEPGGRRPYDQADSFAAVLSCYGPDGEAALTAPVYWVSAARAGNAPGESATAQTKFAEIPASSPGHRIVAATDLFQVNGSVDPSRTLSPGTPVLVHWLLDAGSPPRRRYYFQVADEHANGNTCGSSNSSSSSGGTACLFVFQSKYNCQTSQWGAAYGGNVPRCAVPAGPLNQWVQSNQDPCVYTYTIVAKASCTSYRDCLTVPAPATPALPTFTPPNCCPSSHSSSSSSSGPLVCVFTWDCFYHCKPDGTGSWGIVQRAGINCTAAPATPNQWVPVPGNPCHYQYQKTGPACPAPEQAGGCGAWPENPDPPTLNPPPGCCSSSSSSGPSSSTPSSSGPSSNSTSGPSTSTGGYTGTETIVVGFDPTTCTVTTKQFTYANGLLVSVT